MYIPDSTMTFVIEDSQENDAVFNIPDVLQPAYIYNVGDKIQYVDILDEEHVISMFSVTRVKHEIQQAFISSDQIIVVYLELIRE